METRWFGDISRSFGLAKSIIQGTVQEKEEVERKGGKYNIYEWTGMDFASSTKAAEIKRERGCQEVVCGA